MESKIKASFIPKKPVTGTTKVAKVSHATNSMDLFLLFAIIMSVVVGVLSAGVFLYKNMNEQRYLTKQENLKQLQSEFQPKLIEEFKKLSNRIRTAQEILNNHVAPSAFLYSLERDTLTGVQFTNFKFNQKASDTASFILKGKTSTVNSVALQSSKFSESDFIKNSIFSDIDLVSGGVTFQVTGDVDLNTIRFNNLISVIQQAPSSNSTDDSFIIPTDASTHEGTNNNLDLIDGDFGNFQ